MKKIFATVTIASLFIFLLSEFALAQGVDLYIKGYVHKNRIYGQTHYPSRPNDSFYNNLATVWNRNPHRDSMGTEAYDGSDSLLEYSLPTYIPTYLTSQRVYSNPSYHTLTLDGLPLSGQGRLLDIQEDSNYLDWR